MTITNMPERFGSAFGELCYTLEGGSGVNDIEILAGRPGNINVVGVKRFEGAGPVAVNVAGYVRRLLSPRPVGGRACAFAADEGRTVAAAVRSGSVAAAERIFTCSMEGLEGGQMLKMMPAGGRVLSPGESDEVCFVSPGGLCEAVFEAEGAGSLSFRLEAVAQEGVCSLVVDYDDIADRMAATGGNIAQMRRIQVDIVAGGASVGSISYTLRQMVGNVVRLCWLNRLGGIEYFTFQAPLSEQLRSSKEKVVTPAGIRTVASVAERVVELSSGYQPELVLEVLGGVICSPLVWRVEGENFVPLDVLTDAVVVGGGDMQCMKLRVRESRTVGFQTL